MDTEVKSSGFILAEDANIYVDALGSDSRESGSSASMVAYGWIMNADTRRTIWQMDRDNTEKAKNDRSFKGDIFLRKGRYEVYFTAYAFVSQTLFSKISVNVDRRDKSILGGDRKKRWFVPWVEDLLGKDIDKEWRERAARWGISLTNSSGKRVSIFPPAEESRLTLLRMVGIGENEHRTQRFVLDQPASIRVYALGEMVTPGDPVDYAWILDAKTRRRFWEMRRGRAEYAGGGEKNFKVDQTLSFPAGDYVLYYNSDGSHSFLDWNAAPPEDPLNYGVSLIATDPKTKDHFKLSNVNMEEHALIQLIRVGDDETRSSTFTLKKETRLRVYAIGEKQPSTREMADVGWIVNAKTREKVWSMDVDRTEHAGGGEKNRMIDEVITLPKGTYTVFFRTDDSHAYDDWNTSPPVDPEHWGITIYGAGEHFDKKDIELNATPKETGVIAQMVRIGDHENRSQFFRIDRPTRIRIYALGEGQNREMFDYGWIEDASSHERVWEMTYSMTFHAGGGRKNRVVSTTLLLDTGKYELHYVSDDSHSYPDWNTDPPDDPTMWGITIYRDDE